MINLKSLNKEILNVWGESTETLIFVIKNDMSIINFSRNFLRSLKI